jgi:hypothetical protein
MRSAEKRGWALPGVGDRKRRKRRSKRAWSLVGRSRGSRWSIRCGNREPATTTTRLQLHGLLLLLHFKLLLLMMKAAKRKSDGGAGWDGGG